MVDLGERMLMKVVTIVPIFAGVAASANSESRWHTSNRRLTRTISIPHTRTLHAAKCCHEPVREQPVRRHFLAHAHPLSLSHTELLECVNTVIAECYP